MIQRLKVTLPFSAQYHSNVIGNAQHLGPISQTDLSLFWGLNLTQSDLAC